MRDLPMRKFKASRPSKSARRQAAKLRRDIIMVIATEHKKWTPSETKLFFKRLSQFGANFPRIAMALNRFPEEIADKYETERNVDPQRVVRALAVPIAIEPDISYAEPIIIRHVFPGTPHSKKLCGSSHLHQPVTGEAAPNAGSSGAGQIGGVPVIPEDAGSIDEDEDEDEDDEDYLTDDSSDEDADSDDSYMGSDEDWVRGLDEDLGNELAIDEDSVDEDSGDELSLHEILDDCSGTSLSDDDAFQAHPF